MSSTPFRRSCGKNRKELIAVAKKVCCICGKEMSSWSLDCVPLQIKYNGERLHECRDCFNKYKGKQLFIQNGRATVLEEKDTEIRKKCNACGHLYCYNLYDLERNKQRAKDAALSSIASLGQTLGGAYAAGAVNNATAKNTLNGIVDYNRCPNCGSLDVRTLSPEEGETEQAAAKGQNTPAISAADELKKFKELLDSGVITQEEFDAKKKQLLGL